MTTLDSLVSFAEKVEASAAERKPVDWRRVFLAMLSAVPYLLGLWLGRAVYCVRIMWTAAREGYHEANAPAAPRRPLVSTVDR